MGKSPWYAVRVAPRTESRVSEQLSLRGFEVLVPTHRVRRRWSDRTIDVDEALFSGYLFCRFDPLQWLRIVDTPGVLQVLGVGKNPVAVDEAEIETILAMIASRIVFTSWPYLSAGQKIRLEAGPLAGVEGVIVTSKTGSLRVVVSVSLLQRSVAAVVDRGWIGLAG